MDGGFNTFKGRQRIRALLQKARADMDKLPPQTSEEAYAGLEKRKAMDRAEKARIEPVDTIYITP